MSTRIGPQIRRDRGSVRVQIPASVAYDLSSFQKSIAVIAEKLGCPACFSGADCTFLQERDFIVDERLEVRPASSEISVLPIPIPNPTGQVSATPITLPNPSVVSVNLAPSVSYSLDSIQQAVARVAARLGCEPCHSGFDITFRQELSFAVDEQLNVRLP